MITTAQYRPKASRSRGYYPIGRLEGPRAIALRNMILSVVKGDLACCPMDLLSMTRDLSSANMIFSEGEGDLLLNGSDLASVNKIILSVRRALSYGGIDLLSVNMIFSWGKRDLLSVNRDLSRIRGNVMGMWPFAGAVRLSVGRPTARAPDAGGILSAGLRQGR